MDAEQKYIEESSGFEVDMEFVDRLKELPLHYSLHIAHQVDVNAPNLPEKNGWAQMVGGVVKLDEPLFYEIEYLKQEGEIPIYISITEIDVDEYLDYINLNQILKDEHVQDNAY
tara:strand:+ start:7641 stop:7982 length:342 start_codon:yes stop_codon:yes gene_type:complete